MLEVRGLTVGYHADLHILREVTLTARDGAITAVLGANGTGKSTLLKAVCGFLRPACGDILLGGRSLLHLPRTRWSGWGSPTSPSNPASSRT